MYKLEDKKIIFNDAMSIRELPFLGSGAEGDVYKLKISGKNYAIKIFNGLSEENVKDFRKKLNINIDSFISPLKLLYINNKFKGYLMNYCSGKNFFDRKFNLPIDDFKKSVIKLTSDVEKLSELRYIIQDTYSGNIMYKDGFKIIDIDNYIYDKEESLSEIKRYNIRMMTGFLTEIFIYSTTCESAFLKNTELFSLSKQYISTDMGFMEFFDKVYTIAFNNADREINTISDIGKVLKKVK